MEPLTTSGADMLSLATLIKLDGLETLITGIIGFYIFLWVLSIIWVTRDIHARSNSILLQLVAIIFITVLSPIFWLPIYITMRPVRYKSH